MLSNLTKHAKARMDERLPPDLSKSELDSAVKDPSKVKYIRRLTQGRSLAYVFLSNGIVKVVLSKKLKKVVTVYPWKADYEVTVLIPINFDSFHVVRLYPDCWLETKTPRALTNIVKITKTGFEEIAYLHPDFEILYNKAFEAYDKFLGSGINEDPETKAKVVEIKGYLGDTKIFSEEEWEKGVWNPHA